MTGAYRALVGIERCCQRWKNFQNAVSTSTLVQNQNFHSAQNLSSSSSRGRSGKDKKGRKEKPGIGSEIHKVEFGKKNGGLGEKDGKNAGFNLVCSSCNSPFVHVESFEGYPRFVKCYSCDSLYIQVVEGAKHVVTPRELKACLDQVVVGQERAKIALSSAVYEHYKRVSHNTATHTAVDFQYKETEMPKYRNVSSLAGNPFQPDVSQTNFVQSPSGPHSEIKLQKSNILMLGPTGSGKTYLVSTIAKHLDVPCVEFDCTSLTSYGYVGEDVHTPISKLYIEADGDIQKCQQGIVVLDEIDKIAKKQVGMSHKDVGGESVQQALLKMLEGMKVEISSKGTKSGRMENASKITIDTTNILFIGIGAFSYLDKVIIKRQDKKSIGLGAPVSSDIVHTPITNIADLYSKPSDEEEAKVRDEIFQNVQDIDIIKYGFLPEFVGRMSKFIVTHSLDEDALRRILTEPENALVKQYQCMFGYEKCELEFTEGALNAIVKNALKKKTGARGLKGEIDKLLFMPLYEVPGSDITHVIIDEDCVLKKAKPEYKHKKLDTMDIIIKEEMETSAVNTVNDKDSEKRDLVLKKDGSLTTKVKETTAPERIDK